MSDQPLAYFDRDFIESEEARPLRLLSEYFEPLKRFKAHNVQDTVVFFGSARVHSRYEATRSLDEIGRGKQAKGPEKDRLL